MLSCHIQQIVLIIESYRHSKSVNAVPFVVIGTAVCANKVEGLKVQTESADIWNHAMGLGLSFNGSKFHSEYLQST